MSRRIISVDEDFNKYLEEYLKQIKKDLELLGISTRKVSKTRVSKLLAQKAKENGKNFNIL